MSCVEGHDYIYHGGLNIYDAEELLKVVDVWRCRRCGNMRLGLRGPEVLGSSEGMLPDISGDKHWVLFVCKSSSKPCFEVLQLSDTDKFVHKCSGEEQELHYVRGKGVFYGVDGPMASSCYVYEIGKIVRGYIDLSRTPPEVVTLIK
ncbi:MAG: hypothetical protein RMI43_01675 [Candidatus Caldarchaeum sp.]|nr:hypothetical protein [Candidatus Caldarchaeum sp.]MCS7133221.1 hypothetical protein [Candidatus Caldarchaeum sp.]MDW8062862.1 hypothetical protein [Candidatus Caldarchaeum sp.]MDW8435895.1 hypothetical protein [Candidatus Caldarchaeum sp.]